MAFRGIQNLRSLCVVGGTRVAGLVAVLLLAGLFASPAESMQREDPYAGLSSSQRRVFQNYTRLYCKQFFRFGDDRFVLLPNYERGRENSNGRSYDQAEEEMTEIRVSGLGNETKHPAPAAEVIVSARVIPDIDVGHYGFVNSVVVKEIVGPSEMIVTAIELIPDSEVGTTNNAKRLAAAQRQRGYTYKTYRLLGFSTANLRPSDKYFGPKKKGLQIAVMSTDPKHSFVLVNYDRLERVRTSEFHEALAYVKIEPLGFIDMVRENREKLTLDGDKASLISIYHRYYNRYRPKRLSSTTKPEPIQKDKPEPVQKDKPEPIQKDKPEPVQKEKPKPVEKDPPRKDPAEEEEDDWDYEEEEDSEDKPTFFGIPL